MRNIEFQASLLLLLQYLAACAVTGFVFLRPPSRTTNRIVFHAATVSTKNNDNDSSQLQSMTVKELRQLLIEYGFDERGLQSRLKRKQDIIEYFEEHLDQQELKALGGLQVNDENIYKDDNIDDHDSSVADGITIIDNVSGDSNKINIKLDRSMSAGIGLDVDVDGVDDDVEEEEEYDEDITNYSNDIDFDEKSDISLHDGAGAADDLPISGATNDDKSNNINHEIKMAGQEINEPLRAGTDNNNNNHVDIPPKIKSLIPPGLQAQMIKQGIDKLMPSQLVSFERIYNGRDTVLQAPTGSGKTLSYIIPLLAKSTKRPQPRRFVTLPTILTLAPSRELAKQIGKEWSKMVPKAQKQYYSVATVFGGAPLERHVSMLRKMKPFILVSTPGRLRELVREGHVDYNFVTTIVLDEADTLLNEADSPDVRAILEDMEKSIEYERPKNAEYQMLLVSATINDNVRDFTYELGLSPKRAYLQLKSQGDKENDDDMTASQRDELRAKSMVQLPSTTSSTPTYMTTNLPVVRHWHMSCKSSVRSDITTNIITVLSPRLTIIFVPTKTETEQVASILSASTGIETRVLHGDMSQPARTRCIAILREEIAQKVPQVLVATDVASRGLDLPHVDLVIQYGIPKNSGKDGTYSVELYTHRTGRTGRIGRQEQIASNAILLYDPAEGEAKLIPKLVKDVQKELKVTIRPKSIPSAQQVVEAAYEKTKHRIGLNDGLDQSNLASYMQSKLENEPGMSDPKQLLIYLSRAMAALSNVDPSISPMQPSFSLLTGTLSERTVRLWVLSPSSTPLSPPEVTKYCKSLGSGKIGRVIICKDGSAVFDLPPKKARSLVKKAQAEQENSDYAMELPMTLPET